MLEPESVLQERYQLKQPLSDNPGRQTWLAEDLHSSDSVVVKLLVWGGSKQWEALKLFEREAKVLQNLDHPRIPRYRDYFFLDENRLWSALVQDYIPGASLMELLDRGKKFSETQVREIAIAVLDILSYLHQLNPPVLHRDIKPSNIILGENEAVYLVDFGAVQDRAAIEGSSFTVVGTYGYTPLEQFGGQAVPASDLYALGATLIHLLVGIAPAELLQKDLRLDFRDRVSRTLSPTFLDWLEMLVEPQLDRRLGSTQEAIAALETPGAIAAYTPGAIDWSNLTEIHLKESQRQLAIHIPEPGLKIMKWGKTAIDRVKETIESAIASLQESLSASDVAAQLLVYILIGIGLLTLLSLLLQVAVGVFPLLIFVALFASFSDYFEGTQVLLDRDRDRFEIQHKRLGLNYRTESGVLSEIEEVSIFYDNRRFVMGVELLTRSPDEAIGEYYFGQSGRKLSEQECLGLAKEIRDWLEIDPSETEP
ncbi:serine/threonine protein kinase [Oxynema sp. CENA135]|uniref:serine/threonine protein kinase n=1 Tax=Oxynema sp. CENA135 TaxID=984206 RepID=UPI00190AFC40|nr:serine/threonine-protein kinase [Oxynema sp. CENA135]MBK4731103.1 serine/threonine protein kinase [Oxynema sp. CENA135]